MITDVLCFRRGTASLPGLTKEGNRIILCKMIDPDPNKFIYVDTVKVWVKLNEFLPMELISIFDFFLYLFVIFQIVL